jgi:hypothetical protein
MTEEQQLEAAMKLSLQEAGPVQFAAATAVHRPPETRAGVQCKPPDPGKRVWSGKDPQDLLVPPARSSAKKQRGEPKEATTSQALSDGDVNTLMRLLFGEPEALDLERWLDVGFQFCPRAGLEWGLWQKHGGPCGVFAPVHAFMLKHLLFAADGERRAGPLALKADDEPQSGMLAYALASVLFHSTSSSSYAVCQVTWKTGAALPQRDAGQLAA